MAASEQMNNEVVTLNLNEYGKRCEIIHEIH